MLVARNDIRGSLQRFIEVVAEEAEQNEAFAEKLRAAIAPVGESAERSTRRDRENVPLLGDPFDVYQTGGANGLRAWLEHLELNQLKQLVREHRLDPTRNSDRWKTRERFVQLILKRVPARARQGQAFRHYGEQPPAAKSSGSSGVSARGFGATEQFHTGS